ncbi:MAG TPA: amino acid adenylation domain-containing protein, partial [Longimicrobiaceae bacterium]|nr:amino acid adenylation domain-containing protein [Longimicrobiaceae bacterium]
RGGAGAAAAGGRALEEARTPLDLTRGVLRAVLYRLGEAEHLLLVILHHVATDGWSWGIVWRELSTLYAAFSRGEASPLPEPAFQYADFAVWQRTWLTDEVVREEVDYWRARLQGAPAATELPTDRPRPPLPGYRGGLYLFDLPEPLASRLETLGARRGASLYVVLLAVFKALLLRYTGQEDLVVGAMASHRTGTAMEGLVGYLLNTVALRTSLAGDPSFGDAVDRVRETVLETGEHQHLPFERVLEALETGRDPSRHPLFQTLFVYQRPFDPGTRPAHTPDITLELFELDNRTSKFDLVLYVDESEGKFSGMVEYSTELFDAATAARLAGHYRTLLEAAAGGEAVRLSELPLLGGAERELLLGAWSRGGTAEGAGLHEAFQAAAARTPEAVALVAGERVLAYRELNGRANRLARHLRLRGVGPEVRVAVCTERSAEMVVAVLAVLKAGGAYVPLDPAHPPARTAHVMRDAGVAGVLTETALAAGLPENGAWRVLLDAGWEAAAGERDDDLHVAVDPECLAYVVYTSGTTGSPKGVQVSRLAAARFLASMRERPGITADDVLVAVAPLTFDPSVLDLFLPLGAGARVVLTARGDAADGFRLAETLRGAGATLVQATPSTLRVLLESGAPLPAGLRVLCGGEAMPRDLAASLRPRVAALWNVYGPTETTVWCTAHPVSGEDDEASVPVGRPVANARTYVLDPALQPAPVGVVGELYVGGAGVSRGYLGKPGLTAEKFVPDPFGGEPGARLYRTGDRARWGADGALRYVGRTDFQVKVRGYRIEPGEVESLLARHGGVRACVVVAREDVPGRARLVAYVVGEGAAAPEPASLRAHLAEALPEYMVPGAFVSMPSLPLTPNSKVDRAALPAPDPDVPDVHEAPRTAVEATLARIWAEVLQADRVGIRDSFFELGGDSILAVQIVSRARAEALLIRPRDLFEHPTVAALAGVAAAADPARPGPTAWQSTAPPTPESNVATTEAVKKNPIEDVYPLSPMQEGMLFHSLYEGPGTYVGQFGFTLEGELDGEAFARAWQAVVDRHPALRAAFSWEKVEKPLQVVRRRVTLPVHREDWRALPASEQEARFASYLAADRARGFDPAKPPLMRLALLRTGERQHRLVWTHHHLLLDGWSVGLVYRDVLALYAAQLQGRTAELARPRPYR